MRSGLSRHAVAVHVIEHLFGLLCVHRYDAGRGCPQQSTVLIRDCFDGSFRRSEEVLGALSAPVLGAVSRIETISEREELRRKSRTAMIMVLVLAGVAGLGVVAHVAFEGEISAFVRNLLVR